MQILCQHLAKELQNFQKDTELDDSRGDTGLEEVDEQRETATKTITNRGV